MTERRDSAQAVSTTWVKERAPRRLSRLGGSVRKRRLTDTSSVEAHLEQHRRNSDSDVAGGGASMRPFDRIRMLVDDAGEPRRSLRMKVQDWRSRTLEQSIDDAIALCAEELAKQELEETRLAVGGTKETRQGAVANEEEGEEVDEEHGQKEEEEAAMAAAAAMKLLTPASSVRGQAIMQSEEEMVDPLKQEDRAQAHVKKLPPLQAANSIRPIANADVSRGSRWRMMKALATSTTCGAIFSPESSSITTWRGIVALTSCVYVVYVPMKKAFPELQFTATAERMGELETLLECVLVLDIGVHFLTAAHWRGLTVRDIRFVATSYLTSWFIVDLIAALPFGYSYNKMVRLLALIPAFQAQFDGINPGTVLLAKLLALVVLLWHWAACIFWSIARSEHASIADLASMQTEEQWTPRLHETLESEDFSLAYSHSFFFAVVVTTGVGWDIIPRNATQVFFTSAMIIVGLVFFALLVGSASGAVAAFNATLSGRQAKLEVVNQFLRFHHVPVLLQRRIRAFLHYSWAASGSQTSELESVAELEALPEQLRADLSLSVNRDLIENVPMFQNLSLSAKHAVISTVKRRVYLPGEVIVKEGDEAREVKPPFF